MTITELFSNITHTHLTLILSDSSEYNISISNYFKYTDTRDYHTIYVDNPEDLISHINSNYKSKISSDSIISIIIKNEVYYDYSTQRINSEFLRNFAFEHDATVILFSNKSDRSFDNCSDMTINISNLKSVSILKNRFGRLYDNFSLEDITPMIRDKIIDTILK